MTAAIANRSRNAKQALRSVRCHTMATVPTEQKPRPSIKSYGFLSCPGGTMGGARRHGLARR